MSKTIIYAPSDSAYYLSSYENAIPRLNEIFNQYGVTIEYKSASWASGCYLGVDINGVKNDITTIICSTNAGGQTCHPVFAYNQDNDIFLILKNAESMSSENYNNQLRNYADGIIENGKIIFGCTSLSTSVPINSQLPFFVKSASHTSNPFPLTDNTIFLPIVDKANLGLNDAVIYHPSTSQPMIYQQIVDYNGKRYVGINQTFAIQSDEEEWIYQ